MPFRSFEVTLNVTFSGSLKKYLVLITFDFFVKANLPWVGSIEIYWIN